jgi:hypothetical protein
MTEPEFGPDVTRDIGNVTITYPEWAKVTVKRALASGIVAEFTAREYWTENYAVKGGKEKSIAPNAMWMKRPRGQIAKCAAAQALRIAFPELGAQATAEELEGKALDGGEHEPVPPVQPEKPAMPPCPQSAVDADTTKWRELIQSGRMTADQIINKLLAKWTLTDEQIKQIRSLNVTDVPVTDEAPF